MRTNLIPAFITLFVFLTTTAAVAQIPASHIPKRQLEEMFSAIQRDTKWDLSKPMLWGYFFTDSTRSDLEKAADVLVKQGYRLVDIYSERSASGPQWWLHVEKIEIHTIDTLDIRNAEFDKFARLNRLDTYDGMDVGPPP